MGLYPDLVRRLAVICGAARTAPHTHVVLEGLRATLRADSRSDEARLRSLGRVWAGWGLSQAFYREGSYRRLGFVDLEDFLARGWEAQYVGRDPRDLLAMMATWQAFDLAANDTFDGDFERAMRSIEADALIMPASTDLYFPPEDAELEVALLPRGELAVIPTVWGHAAASADAGADAAFIDERLRELLARG